ncbi:MAG: hypothetical protein II567_11215, partial [Candidatus Riflebacteria bacterium]|nr:hypothetical protein [Candidatus Riflebacteria bacterium]
KIELTYHQAAIMDLDEIKHKKPDNKDKTNEKTSTEGEEQNSQQVDTGQTNSSEEVQAEADKTEQ